MGGCGVVRTRCALAVVIALVACTAVGCVLGEPTQNGVSVENRTGDDLSIVYLVSSVSVESGHVIDRNGTTDLGLASANVTTLVNVPSPMQDSCTIAPIVARRADGTEVARLDAGPCAGRDLVTWTIE